MSVQDVLLFQEQVLRDWIRNPRAWVLLANPVWGSSETVNRIALFDTKEEAEAYLEASKLPESEDPEAYLTKDGYYRTFRPDSFLWDYNPSAHGRPMVIPMIPWQGYEGVQRNPPRPSGPILNGPKEWSPRGIPPLKNLATNHPRYGRDYDEGFGAPYSDMNGALPEPPPIPPKTGAGP